MYRFKKIKNKQTKEVKKMNILDALLFLLNDLMNKELNDDKFNKERVDEIDKKIKSLEKLQDNLS